MPRVTIDGRDVEVAAEATILDAARAIGAYIPTLCYHQKIGGQGICRLCLVEVEGSRAWPPACRTAVEDGMVVRTDTPALSAYRKLMLELIFADGEHDCLTCDRSGQCELQEVAYRLGFETSRFGAQREHLPVDDSHRMIVRNPNKCILCFRCVLGCDGTVVNDVLSVGYRGARSRIVADLNRSLGESRCASCGECIQLCPTGALAERKSAGKARLGLEKVRTTCPYCGVGCQMDLHVDPATNRIVRVTGAEGAFPNDGMLCVKGRFAYDFPSSDKRLTRPLVKKNGAQVPVSWDEALDYTARWLLKIRDTHGPHAISGIGSARDTNENNYATMKFLRAVVGTNNVDHCART